MSLVGFGISLEMAGRRSEELTNGTAGLVSAHPQTSPTRIADAIAFMPISSTNAPPHDFERSENIMQAVVRLSPSAVVLLRRQRCIPQ